MITIMASISFSSEDAIDENSASIPSITTVHPHIIQTHILTRLDGASLASAASASSHLRRLCTEEDLWRDICTATWPSLEDPLANGVISTFPAAHRSIFSDAFPSLHHFTPHSPNHRDRRLSSPPPLEFISAVDIYYQGKPVFSRVKRTETRKGWFLTSPLWVDLLEPNELVPTPVKFVRKDDEWLKHLEENLSLSWILIDPTRKRAANLSSRRPVSVQRHWLTRDLEVTYAVVMAGERHQSTELVQCGVKVTWCGKVGGAMQVRGVNLVMEDTEGRHLSGREGLVILQRAMENGERKKVDCDGKSAKESFGKFSSMMNERREMKHRREKALDAISTVLAFLIFVLICRFMRI